MVLRLRRKLERVLVRVVGERKGRDSVAIRRLLLVLLLLLLLLLLLMVLLLLLLHPRRSSAEHGHSVGSNR